MTGESGICTFNWSCINVAHGVHIGPCVDRFFVGTCCKIPQGAGVSRSDFWNNAAATAAVAAEGTRKIGQVPTYSQFHHTVASKTQTEKLNRSISLFDIGHFNVSLSPADYFDDHYNVTSIPYNHESSELENASDSKQNSPFVFWDYSSASNKKPILSTSFFHTLFLSNNNGFELNKEPFNKPETSVNTPHWTSESQTPFYSKSSSTHDTSYQKKTSPSVYNTRSPSLAGSPHDFRRPVTVHETHNLRKPVGIENTHDLRRPVAVEQSHGQEWPIIDPEAHDLRWPVLDEDDHNLRKPVNHAEDHNLRRPVGVAEHPDPSKPAVHLGETHDIPKPVVDLLETHDLYRPGGLAVAQNKQWPVLEGDLHDKGLSFLHLLKWIGISNNNSLKSSSSSTYSTSNPKQELKTTTTHSSTQSFEPTKTELDSSFPFPSSIFSEKLNASNFGEEDTTTDKIMTTKASETLPSDENTINTMSKFTLFVRPTSSRPSYKPISPLPDTMPTTGTQSIYNASSQVCGISRSGLTARIVGGRKSHYLRWPWMISLRRMEGKVYKHKCGATLLNQYWAITAAHCVDGKLPMDVMLRLGEFNFRRADDMHPHVERRVYVMVIHPEFNHITYENDLALLRFQEPVKLQANIVPVCLPRKLDDITGRIGVVTGWGRLSEEGELPASLHEVHLPILSNKECEQMYYEAGFAENIREVFVCAGISNGGLDACEGDSGGPMVIRGDEGQWILAGLISWGMGCAAPKQPGVYSRISHFTDWIEGIISH